MIVDDVEYKQAFETCFGMTSRFKKSSRCSSIILSYLVLKLDSSLDWFCSEFSHRVYEKIIQEWRLWDMLLGKKI